MKKTQRCMALLLSAVLVFMSIPLSVFADEDAKSGSCGTNLTYNLNSDGLLVISGTGAMDDYSYRNPAPWGTEIKEVIIEDGVTNIGDRAFYECPNLSSVTISSNTEYIGEYAFDNCSSLVSVIIPDSVTTIEDEAFNNCSNLINVSFGNNVQQIGAGAFGSCDSLVSINLPKSVSYIGGGAFGHCTSLSQITIPQKVKSIERRTFQYCSALTSITIPSTITNIGVEAFWHCDNLISISIPGSVTEIGGKAFAGCDNLCNVTISNGVQSLGTEAFASCPKLKSITLPNSLTSTGPMTFEGSGLTYVEIQEGIEKIGNGSFMYCSNLQSVAIPNSVTEIGGEAFLGCDSLKQINIPDSVSTIGRQAFHGCDSLESVRLPNGITGIGNFTLADCGNLKTIFIPKSVKGISMYAFRGCYNLQDVYYSGTEEEWLQISWHEDSGKGNFTHANIHYNSTGDFVIPFTQLYFIEPIVILDIGESKSLSVHSRDVAYVNGEFVYSNNKVINASDIDWNTEFYEEAGIIEINNNGQITALSEGYQHILINRKEDINQSAFCHVFVGDPNELHYTSTYDTKQYYADGGFYSEVSSISDCVELYILFENKLKEAVENISGIDETISKDTEKETFKDVKPITLTATVNGAGLSFDRETYQNTYTVTLETISLREAVDDILMLFPYNLNVASSGNNYTVTVTLESESFETITDEYSFTVENLETRSANEHIDFVSSNKDYKVSKQNIYGGTMVTLKNDAEYKWSKYSTFDFENYYEVVFADILIELMNTSRLGHVSLLPVVKEWVGNYKTILSEVSTIVEDDYTGYLNVTENAIDKVLKKSKYTTEGMDVHDEIRDLVVLKLRDKVSIDKVNSAFAAIDKTQQYFSFFQLSVDITNDIADFIDSVSVLNAYKEMDDEFKAVIQNLYNQIPSSEKKLKDAVCHYVNVDSYLGYSSEILNEVRDMAGDITLDVFNTVYKKQVLSSICKSIGSIQLKSGALFSSTAAFSGISTAIGSFTTGVQLGLCISDILCDSSGKSEEMSKVVAMSEFSPYVINTLNHYGSKLYTDRNDTAVTYYEYAFAMHKATQSYIIQHTINSLEIKRDSLIIKLFGRDDYDGLISDILAYKKSVDNIECHNTNPASSVVTETKVIAIKCPVNVFVYDESGTEVVKIVYDNKEYVADGINVFVEDGEKYIALPTDQKYSIKIIATDSGTMEYTVTEYGAGAQRLRTIEKENIPLENNREFNGQVVAPMNVSPESYALTYDNKTVVADNIVNVPVIGVELNVDNITMNIGESKKLSASVTPDNATNKGVTWSSDNPNVVKVDKDGNITALATGMATITVSSDDWGFIDTCTITVSCSHVQESEWSKDTEKHWHECPSCHNITDIDEHTFGDWTVIKDATETQKGNKEKECAVCKYKVTEEIPVIKGEDTTSSNTDTDVSNNDSSDDVNNATKPESSQANSPQTGDNNILIFWIAVLFVSVGVFVNLNVCSRKRKNN